MKISKLEGKRVALWGWGREGRAAFAVLRERLPTLPLSLFCPAAEVEAARAETQGVLDVRGEPSAEALAAFDVVIKSPGISPYQPIALAAEGQGTRFIGGTALWFAEHAADDGIVHDTVCVTGTKGKSTTTALVAHLLRAAGHRTGLVGNIGLPLLEVLDPQPAPEYWAVELSSYQTGEVARSGARPQVAVVLNLFPEHLDWHGSEQRYIEDKLRLVTEAAPRIAVLNAADPHWPRCRCPTAKWSGSTSRRAGTCAATSCIAVSRPCLIPATRRCRAATTVATCARCWPRWKRWGWMPRRLRRRCRTSVRCRTVCSASAWPMA